MLSVGVKCRKTERIPSSRKSRPQNSIVFGRCPSAGHLRVTAVIRFAPGGTVNLQHGVDADFPDPLRDKNLLAADGDFPLVFMAADFSLDRHVRASAERAGEKPGASNVWNDSEDDGDLFKPIWRWAEAFQNGLEREIVSRGQPSSDSPTRRTHGC